MLQPKDFYNQLKKSGLDFFCGVPDSLLQDFAAYVMDNSSGDSHIITANEGNAIALASGHYLATGKAGIVYMQNSGLGNCVNPLLSLADEEVYSIPLLMIIGWRGEPNVKDEPQHVKQGKVTLSLLEAMGISYAVLSPDADEAGKEIEKAVLYMKENKKPYAFVVRKGTFEKYKLINKPKNDYEMSREDAICFMADRLSDDDITVSTTGKISRELYECRERERTGHAKDFLTVGSMGHASSIALGIALEKKYRNVFCFDGDGAFLMHAGALPVIASAKVKDFKHVVFNNEAHESVGGHPTVAGLVDFKASALAFGYGKAFSIKTKAELLSVIDEFISFEGTALLEIKVASGSRDDLCRPKEKPRQNKESFMSFLEENKTYLGRGAIDNLGKEVNQLKPAKVLVFTGKKSFEEIRPLVEKQLSGVEAEYYSDFETNPKVADVEKALAKLDGKYDLMVAVGGGSVIDFAKLFRFSYDNKVDIAEYLKSGGTVGEAKTCLIAVPTTAGTGSEATKFAVVYMDGRKYSLEVSSVLPDIAIVDSQFVEKSPRYLKACSAMDAFCQALEAYWSVNSTASSIAYSLQAIELCDKHLSKYVNSEDAEAALMMATASNLAGKAINIARTTAAHAISYNLTTEYGLPHGHAVALSIANLFKYNFNIDDESNQDKRGADYVKEKMAKLLEVLGISSADGINKYFKKLFDGISLEYDLDKLNIKDIKKIMSSINQDRLKNNPKKLADDELMNILCLATDIILKVS